MKKSTRALVGLVVLEGLLLAGAAWMIVQVHLGVLTPANPSEAITAITQTAGAAMGVVAGVLIVAYFVHKRNRN